MGLEPGLASILLVSVLVFEALILLVAANSGFHSGTSVLANMSADSWLPHQFGDLSRRLAARRAGQARRGGDDPGRPAAR